MQSFTLLLFLLLAPACGVCAQTLALFNIDASGFPVIRAKFLALDSAGNILRNIPDSAWVLSENDIPVNAVLTINCPPVTPIQPASVVLVSDRSGSMDTPLENQGGLKRIDLLKSGIATFIKTLKLTAPSAIALTAFDDAPEMIKDFSTNTDSLLRALQFVTPGGGTVYNPAFMDPLLGGVNLLARRPAGIRRALVFLTDGEPNDSLLTDSVIAVARAANVTIYAVTIGMPMNRDLERIALNTGGMAFGNVYTSEQIKAVYAQIAISNTGQEPCSLQWNSFAGCGAASLNRQVRLLQRTDSLMSATSAYRAPASAARLLQLSQSFLYFNGTGSIDRTLTMTARNDSFTVDSMFILSGTKFSILNWGGTPPPFTLQDGQSRIITVRLRASDSSVASAILHMNTRPCATPPVTLTGGARQYGKVLGLRLLEPIGGERYSGCDSVVIRWSGVGIGDTVKLEYTRRGYPWITITDKATNLAYTWWPPAPDSTYLVRVSARFKSENVINTVAGGGSVTDDSVSSESVQLYIPTGVALDSNQLYIVENGGHRVRRLALDSNLVTIVAGTGAPGFANDGFPGKLARMTNPYSAAVWNKKLYITDYSNHRIRVVDLVSGIINTYAGTGGSGFSGDGGQAIDAQLQYPAGLAAAAGQLYFSEVGNNRVRKIDLSTGVISTVAGGGLTPNGDGVPATAVLLQKPTGICLYGDSLYITETDGNRIRCVNLTNGILTTIAGVGTAGFSGDGGQAVDAQFNAPGGVGVNNEHIYVTDAQNNRIRRISRSTGIITTFSGNGNTGSYANGIPAQAARLDLPAQPVVTRNAIFFPEYYVDRIRVITLELDGADSSGSRFSVSTPRIAVNPAINGKIVDMGGRAVGAPGRDSMVTAAVCNVGAMPLSIDSVRFTGQNPSDFKVVSGLSTAEIAPNSCRALELRFRPQALGFRRAFAILYGRCGGQDTIELRGIGTPSCGLATLGMADFGTEVVSVVRADSVLKTAVCNNGSAPVSGNITVNSTNGSFVVTTGGGPFTLAPGQCRDVTIVFAPKAVGLVTGTIYYGIDPQCGTASTLLYGYGRAPQLPGLPSGVLFARQQCYAGPQDTTALITNVGGSQLHITDITLSGSGGIFTIISSIPTTAAPMTIDPGGRDSIRLRFNPVRAGTYTSTIYLKSDAPFGRTSFDVTGGRDSMSLALQAGAVIFDGRMGGSPFPRDTFAVMKNTGSVLLRVVSADITGRDQAGFTVPGGQFPLDIAPDSVGMIKVSALGPTGDSALRAVLRLHTQPTCDSGIVPVDLIEPGAAPLLTYGPAPFAPVRCPGAFSDTTVLLGNAGGDVLQITGAGIQNDPEGNFQVTFPGALQLTPGQSLRLAVRFAPKSAGTKSSVLVLQTNMNPRDVRLPLNARRDSTGFISLPTAVGFSGLPLNQTADTVIRLRNTGDLPVAWLVSVRGGRFVVLSVEPPVAAPGQESVVQIRFNGAPANGLYTDTLQVSESRCGSVTLGALSALVGENVHTVLSMPVMTVPVGKRGLIPLRLRTPDRAAFNRSGAADYQVTVQYRGTLFIPDSVRYGTVVRNVYDTKTGLQTVSWTGRYDPRRIDTMAALDGVAMLGDTNTTPLVITAFGWTTPGLTVETVNGTLGIDGTCFDLGLRLVVRPKVLKIRPQPVTGGAAVADISLDQSAGLTVRLSDLLGQTVATLPENYLTAGTHTLALPVAGLPPGLYLLTLSTAFGRTTVPVVIGD